jgi:hypothetical protein
MFSHVASYSLMFSHVPSYSLIFPHVHVSRPNTKSCHEQPDNHAPERPPSAYVIFSNSQLSLQNVSSHIALTGWILVAEIRDQLKGQELSFTEIAKLVGERWQELQAHEREPCEREAQALKNTYYSELRQYKKTSQYSQYQDYLADFKAKHSEDTGQG